MNGGVFSPVTCNLVVGTAGHIDHGKTTLIHALTRTDTDRLAEEKRRGISIDLGFAHVGLPGEVSISFIDVPGHERFVKNMLAGAGGIGAVMLIVAADEGIKPQTREHFEICRLLGIPSGLLVITKIDIASPDQLQQTTEAIKVLVAGSFLQQSLILPVSARTQHGLPALRNALAQLARETTAHGANGLARLAIDRTFAAKGFGTVVTGTLTGGAVQVGDTVRFYPGDKNGRIRALQVHGRPVTKAQPGERTAMNLTGVDHLELERGFVVTHENDLAPTTIFDSEVEWLSDVSVPQKREHFLLHVGTTEIQAHLKVFGPAADGKPSRSFARISLTTPALLLPGDRFILRRPSPAATVAGGVVVDPFPPVRLNRSRTIARLSSLASADPLQRIELLVGESSNGKKISDLVRRTGMPLASLIKTSKATSNLLFVEAANKIFTTAWLAAARARLLLWLKTYHTQHPQSAGAPIAQARLTLEPAIAAAVFSGMPELRITGDLISLVSHKVQADPEQSKLLSQIEYAFRQAGFQPPAPAGVLQQAGADQIKGRALLEALIKAQRLVRISDTVIFHIDVLNHIRNSLALHKGRKFSIPEFKEWTQVSRRYAVPLLEYLDRQHVTRREGDARVIL